MKFGIAIALGAIIGGGLCFLAVTHGVDVPDDSTPVMYLPVHKPLERPIYINGLFGRRRRSGMFSILLPGCTGNAKTAEASLKGLRWLSAVQNKDGSWATADHALAATGLAVLAYLSMEERSWHPTEFDETVCAALDYLIREFDKDCAVLRSSDEAGFAMATAALCETYRQIWNPNLGTAAQKGLRAIVEQQELPVAPPCESGTTWTNSLVATGWNLIALENGAKAKYLVDPNGLRGGLDVETAGFGAFSNVLAQISQKWAGTASTSAKTDMAQGTGDKSLHGDNGGVLHTHLQYFATRNAFDQGIDRWGKWYDKMWPSLVMAQFTTPAGEPGIKCGCPACSGGVWGEGLKEPYRREDGRDAEIGHWVGFAADPDSIIMDTCLAILELNKGLELSSSILSKYLWIEEEPRSDAQPTEPDDIEADFGI